MQQHRFGHIAALDGIRAIAILAVLIVHASGRFRGGVLGVDIFFALSGFLITGLLLSENEKFGRIDRGRFYARRALRLWPALICGVALALLLSHWTPSPGAVPVGYSALAALTYTSNIVIVSVQQGLGTLNHTWSLSVEEQFYLLWPLALGVPAVRRNLMTVLPIAIVGLVIVRAVLAHHRLETLLPFHADELLLGAWLAAALHQVGPRVVRPTAPTWVPVGAGVLFLALAALVPARDVPFLMRGGYTAAAVLTVVVIAHVVAAPASWVSRVLAIPPLVAIGRVSYGVYVYHFPIFLWAAQRGWSKPEKDVIEFAATAVATTVSWFVIERRALALKDRLGRVRSPIAQATSAPV